MLAMSSLMMPVPMLGASQLVHKPPEAKLLAIHSAHNQPQVTPQHHMQQQQNHMQQQQPLQQQSKPGRVHDYKFHLMHYIDIAFWVSHSTQIRTLAEK